MHRPPLPRDAMAHLTRLMTRPFTGDGLAAPTATLSAQLSLQDSRMGNSHFEPLRGTSMTATLILSLWIVNPSPFGELPKRGASFLANGAAMATPLTTGSVSLFVTRALSRGSAKDGQQRTASANPEAHGPRTAASPHFIRLHEGQWPILPLPPWRHTSSSAPALLWVQTNGPRVHREPHRPTNPRFASSGCKAFTRPSVRPSSGIPTTTTVPQPSSLPTTMIASIRPSSSDACAIARSGELPQPDARSLGRTYATHAPSGSATPLLNYNPRLRRGAVN